MLSAASLQETKLEPSSDQQLCTVGNPPTSGESQSVTNEAIVAQSDQHASLTDDTAADQKVCWLRVLLTTWL